MKVTNLLLFLLLLALVWTKIPSPELSKIRIEEASKIVELYENRILDARLDLEQNEESLRFAKERHERLHLLVKNGSIPLEQIKQAEEDAKLAEMNVRGSKISLKEVEIELELTKIRLRAAVISPDDFTIYVDQRKR